MISVYKKPKFNLYSSKEYIFRVISLEDVETIRQWRNSQKKFLRQSKNLSKNDQIKYWNDKILPPFNNEMPDQLLFCLLSRNKEELLAYGGLVHVDWNKKHAESSFLANPLFNQETIK